MILFKNAEINYPIYENNLYFKNMIFKKIFSTSTNNYYNVFKNINLEIVPGDRVALIGKNGSGKTTLLRVLLNILPISNGIYRNDFQNILGLISLDSGLNQDSNAIENIQMMNQFYDIKKNLSDDDILKIIDFAELEKYQNWPIRKYSSGMKLRLLFALYTFQIKDCYIIDEWLSVGDNSFKKKREKKLDELISKCKVLVCASQNHELLKTLCNKFLLLENNNIKIISPKDF